MAKHSLIAGGTGFIGRRLIKQLTRDGYEVTVLSRTPDEARMTWFDLARKGIPKGVNSVVNLAGQNVLDPTQRWTKAFKSTVWSSRIDTSIALVKAIKAAPQVKVFVNITGVHHYRPDDEKIYSEQDQVEEFDYMSKLSLSLERAGTLPIEVQQRCRNVRIRTGVVVGRDGGMIESLWLPFKLGLGGPIGSGKQILPWIHVEDLCRLIHHCVESSHCKGVLNGVAPEIITNEEFAKTFAAALHRPCVMNVPELLINTIFGKERSALLLTGAKIQPKRTLKTGFEFKYPTVKEACREVVKQFH